MSGSQLLPVGAGVTGLSTGVVPSNTLTGTIGEQPCSLVEPLSSGQQCILGSSLYVRGCKSSTWPGKGVIERCQGCP